MDNQYGVYQILEKDIELSAIKNRVYWKCQCERCGNIISVRLDGLKRLPQSCPKCKNDITGQQFGRLTVLYKTRTDKNGHSYWMCQCECGNQKEISATNLKSNRTLSCGCLQKEMTSKAHLIDLTGKKFGKLTVIKRDENKLSTKTKWICQCDCGTILSVEGSNLKNNHTTSCGCIHSKGELKLRELLNQLAIPYFTQYLFKDLPKRYFDFYIPSFNLCIEYDGKQHFEYINTWHQTIESFNEAKQRDNEKNEFCQKNSIPLIRIPYTDYEKLDETYILNLLNMEEAEDIANEN